MNIRKSAKGFTLIELMIVVAIIGILAAIAIPNFIKFQCKAKQGEAKTNLKALFVLEESYRAEHEQYGPTFGACGSTGTNGTIGTRCDGASSPSKVGFGPKAAKIRYNYALTASTATTFLGTALVDAAFVNDLSTGATVATGDNWSINQQSAIVNTRNGCE